jgi:DNA-binding MarR family transcriptional regulator
MSDDLDADRIAATLMASVGTLVRRVRQVRVSGEQLSMPERQALSRLDREGPTTSSALARQAQITAQSMGATVAALRARGLVERRADPEDGRCAVLTVTDAGRQVLKDTRDAKADLLARALAAAFTRTELEQFAAVAPLLERLARSI